MVERYLEGERHHAVCEGHAEVGAHGGDPPVKHELAEVQWWMAGRDEEFHVRGHVEGEGEERDDDQVDETDGDRRQGDRWMEGPQIVF